MHCGGGCGSEFLTGKEKSGESIGGFRLTLPLVLFGFGVGFCNLVCQIQKGKYQFIR